MSAIAKLIKGGAWLTLANVVSKLASALALPLLARLLGPESLGIYSVVFSLAQSAQSFSTLGADVAMQRNGAQHNTLGTDAVGRLFGVGLSLICLVSAVTGLGIWFFREPLAKHWLGQPDVIPWLGATAILIVLQPWGNIPLLFLASLQDFRAYALRSSLGMIVSSAATVVLAWKFGLAGAVQGLLLAAIAQIVWSYLIVKPVLRSKGIRLRVDRFWQESHSILKFGFPYYFGNTLLSTLVSLPLMGLVSQYGGLEQLGYLRVAQSMAALIGFIPSAIAPAAISYLSASSLEDKESYQDLKSVHLRGVWILLLVPTGAVCLVLPDLIHWLFGDVYQQATVLSWLSLWISTIAGIASVLVQCLLAMGKTVRVAWISSLGAICGVLVTLILVPKYQALGFLLGQLSGQLVGLLFCVHSVVSDLKTNDLNSLKWLLFISLLIMECSISVSLLNLSAIVRWLLVLILIIILFIFIFKYVLKSGEKLSLLNLANQLKKKLNLKIHGN
ncbi:MAG: oligosaccharide flippase family protein [Cyanobacteriota bacterium]